MDNPWIILGLGLVVVFTALGLLVFFIAALRLLFTKKVAKVKIVDSVVQAPKSEDIDYHSNPELVAIIMAAICAVTGESANNLTIKRIERTGFSTPIWGRINRLNGSFE